MLTNGKFGALAELQHLYIYPFIPFVYLYFSEELYFAQAEFDLRTFVLSLCSFWISTLKRQLSYKLIVSTNDLSFAWLSRQNHNKSTVTLCTCTYANTYSDFLHGLLHSFPQGPGSITHQVCDVQALAQGHKLCILVSVSGGGRHASIIIMEKHKHSFRTTTHMENAYTLSEQQLVWRTQTQLHDNNYRLPGCLPPCVSDNCVGLMCYSSVTTVSQQMTMTCNRWTRVCNWKKLSDIMWTHRPSLVWSS